MPNRCRNKTKKSKALTTLLFLSYPYFSLLKKKRVINIASLSLSALSTPEADDIKNPPLGRTLIKFQYYSI